MIGGLFVVALCFATYSIPMAMVAGDSLAASRTWADYGETLFAWFVRYLVGFGPVLLALTIADNLPLAGFARIAALAIAIVLGAQVQWPLRCLYEPGAETACADFLSWFDDADRIRESISKLIHCSAADVAFVPNASTALGVLMSGIKWNAGDRIVSLKDEFPNLSKVDVKRLLDPSFLQKLDRDGYIDSLAPKPATGS